MVTAGPGGPSRQRVGRGRRARYQRLPRVLAFPRAGRCDPYVDRSVHRHRAASADTMPRGPAPRRAGAPVIGHMLPGQHLVSRPSPGPQALQAGRCPGGPAPPRCEPVPVPAGTPPHRLGCRALTFRRGRVWSGVGVPSGRFYAARWAIDRVESAPLCHVGVCRPRQQLPRAPPAVRSGPCVPLLTFLRSPCATGSPRGVPVPAGRPSLAELARAIAARTEPVPIPWDCVDGFYEAYWRRPEAYLDDHVRRGMSVWARVGPDAEQRAVCRLRDDLASGRWAERNRDLLRLDAAELDSRLLIA